MNRLKKGPVLFLLVLIFILMIIRVPNDDQGEISYKKMASMKIESLGIVEIVKSSPTVAEVLKKPISRSFTKVEIAKIQEIFWNAEKSKYDGSWPSLLVAKDGKGKAYWVSFEVFHVIRNVLFPYGHSEELYEYFEEIGVVKKPQINSPRDPNDLEPSSSLKRMYKNIKE